MLLAAKLSMPRAGAVHYIKSISINSSDFGEGKRPRQNRSQVGGGHFRSAGLDYCATGKRRRTEHPQGHPTHGGARRKKGVQTATHSATCRESEELGRKPVRERPRPLRLISLGRPLGWKGIHLALQALVKFHREYPNSEYWHVGRTYAGSPGRDGAHTRRREEFQDHPRCKPTGVRSRSDIYYSQLGCFRRHGGRASGPFVYGMPDVPNIDQAGFSTRLDRPENSIEDLSQAMLKLARNPGLRIQMGQAGRELVRAHFNMESWFRTMEEILEDVAAEGQESLQLAGAVAPHHVY